MSWSVRRALMSAALIGWAAASQAQVDSSSYVPIAFELVRALQGNEVGVGLNGAFNNWGGASNSEPLMMTNVGGNDWKITAKLPQGAWEYKFVTYYFNGIGDTIISSWITDPNNPLVSGPYNNSVMHAFNPIVYYLLPLTNSKTNLVRPPITAKISCSDTSTIDAQSITLSVDGIPVSNASQYYNSSTRFFAYTPPPMTYATHSAQLTVMTTAGKADTVATSFMVVNEILTAPYTFVFDPLSPNFIPVGQISSVQIKGTFNNLGSDPLTGPDSDGVYSRVVPLGIATANFYQFILNGGQYIDDPDNPLMEKDFGTIAVKIVRPVPSFQFIQPRQSQLFTPGSSIAAKVDLMESDSGWAIDPTSAQVLLDGSPLTVSVTDSIANGYHVETQSFLVTTGRHQLKFIGADIHGRSTTSYLTFGSFASGTGFHYVDGDFDDNGPGNYLYPSFSGPGSADIKQVDVTTNATNDSLFVAVTFAAITDYSRVGFLLLNAIDGPRILAPDKAGINIPSFVNRGVFVSIASPTSAQLAPINNRLITDPAQVPSTRPVVVVNSDAAATGVFRFAFSLDSLQAIMGSYTGSWYYIAYSYFGNTSGGWKVGASSHGSPFSESPNVYDAAFFFNNGIEKRNLANYNYSFNNGGSRYVTLASGLRGVMPVAPGDVSPSLAGKPLVRILSEGGEMRFSDTIKVFVAVSGPSVTTGTLWVNTTSYPLSYANDTASAVVILADGLNTLQATATYNTSLTSNSSRVYFNRIRPHRPVVAIAKSIGGGMVSLDASGTTNPDGLVQTFQWTQDISDPEQVNLGGGALPSVSFGVPSKKGEYHLMVTCSTFLASAYGSQVLLVDSSGAHFPDLTTWHSAWIDTAIIYEVYVKTLTLDGDLNGVILSLPQIQDLGVNTIWLMPVHPTPQLSPSQPGYAITNYYDINPVYGTKAIFKALVDSAHARGIRVVMDYVVNHTHNTHPFLLDAYKYGPASPYRNFYSWNPDGSYQYLFTWADLPSINYADQKNMDYLVDMAKFWVQDYHVDGFRCDVAWGVNDLRPTGPAFWQRWRSELKAMKPDLLLLGELDASNLTYFDKKFDSGYDYLTFNAIKNALSNNTSLSQLDTALAFYNAPSYPSFVRPLRYLENHDESRLIAAMNGDLGKVRLGATVLLTSPGLPMLYAGQEVGEQSYRGLIDWSDPNGLRPFYKKLVGIRRTYRSLETGRFALISATGSDSIIAYARVSDTLSAAVFHNFAPGPATFTAVIDTALFHMKPGKTYYFNDVLNGGVYPVTAGTARTFQMTLPVSSSAVMIFSDTAFVTSVREQTSRPFQFALDQNYPNPFNPSTVIKFSIGGTAAASVHLDVYNILGQKVKTLVDDTRSPGDYTFVWDSKNENGNRVASGVYFYMLRAGSFVQTKKMILLK